MHSNIDFIPSIRAWIYFDNCSFMYDFSYWRWSGGVCTGWRGSALCFRRPAARGSTCARPLLASTHARSGAWPLWGPGLRAVLVHLLFFHQPLLWALVFKMQWRVDETSENKLSLALTNIPVTLVLSMQAILLIVLYFYPSHPYSLYFCPFPISLFTSL